MSRFRGQIEDVFKIPSKEGFVFKLTNIEGHPEVGMSISVGGKTRRIVELGRNSTDGKHVSERSCLTGRPCAPYGGILVDWPGHFSEAKALRLQWVSEEIEQ